MDQGDGDASSHARGVLSSPRLETRIKSGRRIKPSLKIVAEAERRAWKRLITWVWQSGGLVLDEGEEGCSSICSDRAGAI